MNFLTSQINVVKVLIWEDVSAGAIFSLKLSVWQHEVKLKKQNHAFFKD